MKSKYEGYLIGFNSKPTLPIQSIPTLEEVKDAYEPVFDDLMKSTMNDVKHWIGQESVIRMYKWIVSKMLPIQGEQKNTEKA